MRANPSPVNKPSPVIKPSHMNKPSPVVSPSSALSSCSILLPFTPRALRCTPLALLFILLALALAIPASLSAQSFGGAVLVVDGMVVVGESAHEREPGSVRAFTMNGGEWSELWSLQAPEPAVQDGFGRSLAHVRGTLLVGTGRGAESRVNVYRLADPGRGDAEPVQTLEEEGLSSFGSALLASGPELAVAARSDGGDRVLSIWRLGNDDMWSHGSTLALSDDAGNIFDFAGDLVAVANPGRSAHIHERAEDGSWGAAIELAWPGDEDQLAIFGSSVAVADGEVLVGQMRFFDSPAAVHRFAKVDGDWSAVGTLAPEEEGDGDFGTTLAFDGTTLYAGGSARLYSYVRQGGDWALTGASEMGAGRGGGAVVGSQKLVFGGGVAAFGDPGADFGLGAVTVLVRDGDTWTHSARLVVDHNPLPAIRGGEVPCDDGGAAGYDCDHVDLLSFMPREALGAGRGARLNDVWGWTDSETGREIALVGRMDGTAFVDVTDAANPRYLGNLAMTEGSRANTWRDMKVYRDHAFVVADGAGQHGMQIFDLTQLRNVTEPRQFEATAMYNGIASSHNIAINEETGFAYLVGSSDGGESCGGGSHMVDINDPLNPVFAGCFAHEGTGRRNTGNSHDTQCVVYHGPDQDYAGREICVNSNETALSVADVTDKDNPVAIAAADYPNVAYAHQGWLTEDHRYFYSNDELDEVGNLVDATRTLIWDLEDLDDPLLISEYMNPTRATDHNLYVRGDRLFMSNNRAGLRVLDISDPENPTELGYFDTTPWGLDESGFDGTWSVYPYFESGTVLLSSRREGLFIVRPRPRRLVP